MVDQLQPFEGRGEDSSSALLLASDVFDLAVELLSYSEDQLAPRQLERLEQVAALWESAEDPFRERVGDSLKDFVQTEQWAQLRRMAQETLRTFDNQR